PPAARTSATPDTATTPTPAHSLHDALPIYLTATAVSTTQINLSWSDNSNNETGFIVERSPDGTDTWTQVGTPAANATTFQNTGLTAGTKYFYRVRATNGGTDSANSTVANATTVPAAPGTLTASAISSTQINLSWGNVSGETG